MARDLLVVGVSSLSNDERKSLFSLIDSFCRRYEHSCGDLKVHLSLRPVRKTRHRLTAFEARLFLSNRLGSFFASSQDFGAVKSVRNSLSSIDFQLRRKLSRLEES